MSLAREFETFASEVGDELNRINRGIGTRQVADKLKTESNTIVGGINEIKDEVCGVKGFIGEWDVNFTETFLTELYAEDDVENENECDCPCQHPKPPCSKPPHMPPPPPKPWKKW